MSLADRELDGRGRPIFRCQCQWKCGYRVAENKRYVARHSPTAWLPPVFCRCGCGMPTLGPMSPYYGDHRPEHDTLIARSPIPEHIQQALAEKHAEERRAAEAAAEGERLRVPSLLERMHAVRGTGKVAA